MSCKTIFRLKLQYLYTYNNAYKHLAKIIDLYRWYIKKMTLFSEDTAVAESMLSELVIGGMSKFRRRRQRRAGVL